MAIRQLLDGVERTLPLDTFQKLTIFQKQNGFSNLEKALDKLLELTKKSDEVAATTLSPADTLLVKEEIRLLLNNLKPVSLGSDEE